MEPITDLVGDGSTLWASVALLSVSVLGLLLGIRFLGKVDRDDGPPLRDDHSREWWSNFWASDPSDTLDGKRSLPE